MQTSPVRNIYIKNKTNFISMSMGTVRWSIVWHGHCRHWLSDDNAQGRESSTTNEKNNNKQIASASVNTNLYWKTGQNNKRNLYFLFFIFVSWLPKHKNVDTINPLAKCKASSLAHVLHINWTLFCMFPVGASFKFPFLYFD